MKTNQFVLFLLLVCLSVSAGFLAKLSWERVTPRLSAPLPGKVLPAPPAQPTPQAPRPEVLITDESGPISVNEPIELTGKTRQEIYALRTQYVENSIFKVPGYTPSEEVYGQIDDTKPWIAVTACRWPENSAMPTRGPSEETRFINNPTVLIGVEQGWLGIDENKPSVFKTHYGETFCTSPELNFIPKHISYDAQAKEITVVYSKPKVYITSTNNMYYLNGKNARDLGFPYAYMDLSESLTVAQFANEANISNRVVQFQDFIHVGYNCGVSGGCNNGSPNQPMLNFNGNFPQEPSQIFYFKLWRNKPHSPQDPADIVERIIFE